MATAILDQECCYVSTPEHLRSFTGRLVWIYTGKGSLHLTTDSLSMTGDSVAFNLPLGSIRQVSPGSFPRLAKPVRLDYIAVTWALDGAEGTILLTPTQSWATPVWQTNKLVANWMQALDQAVRGYWAAAGTPV